jgi:structural maintenance of chromosome 2
VVEDEVTAKALLAKGKLQRRVTIIPLNKITDRTVKSSVVAEAKKQVRLSL